MTILKIILLSLVFGAQGSCTGVRTIDSRPLLLQPENLKKIGYPIPVQGPPKTVYVKQSQIDIKELDQKNNTGSLFNLADEKNDLYGNLNPDGVGRFVDVFIHLPRTKDGKDNKEGHLKEAALKDGESHKRTPEEEELIKQFPELIPPEAENLRVQHFFKMQIMQKFPNGDVLAFYKRTSEAIDEYRSLAVSARIPYGEMVKTGELTTDDLCDVHFVQISPIDSMDRRSSNWEDEYSLRISRFHESQSREAAELALKRKDLNQLRQRMLDRLKAFGTERAQTAKQRDSLLDERKKDAELIDKLKAKVDDQDKQLSDLQKGNAPKPGVQSPTGPVPPPPPPPPAGPPKIPPAATAGNP